MMLALVKLWLERLKQNKGASFPDVGFADGDAVITISQTRGLREPVRLQQVVPSQ